jgi:hypothetical protein
MQKFRISPTAGAAQAHTQRLHGAHLAARTRENTARGTARAAQAPFQLQFEDGPAGVGEKGDVDIVRISDMKNRRS